MRYRDLLRPLRHSLACTDFMDCVKDIGAIVPVSAPIADADHHVF
jgi:hypothetical protein